MSCRRAALPTAVLALALVLSACASPSGLAARVPAEKAKVLFMPEVTYDRTAAGKQISAEDDRCNTPRLLAEGIRERVARSYVLAAGLSERPADALTLRLFIDDLHLRDGGTTAGRKRIRVRGVLEQKGVASLYFVAQREIRVPFGVRRSVCHAALNVAESLSGDIAQWLAQPADGAVLVNGS